MNRRRPFAALAVLSLTGCTLDFDGLLPGSGGSGNAGGGTGATTTTTTSTSSGGASGTGGTGGTGGAGGGSTMCPGGCEDGAGCSSGDTVAACRIDGQSACESCDDGNACTQDACGIGACTHQPLTGPCPGGVCSGATCMPLAENCSDGLDNNSNGLVDCADPICTTNGLYACIPAAPAGWTGPSALYLGAPGQSCGGAYSVTTSNGGTSVNAAPASCSACTCSPAPSCSASNLTIERKSPMETSCDATCEFTWPIPANTCSNLAAQMNNDPCGYANASWFNWTFASFGTGACGASTQSPTIPPAAWAQQAAVCAPTQVSSGGCTASQVCAPATSPPLSSTRCIHKAGDVACDQVGYPNKSLVYGSINDTRACTACGCTSPSCAGTMHIYDVANCQSQIDSGPVGVSVCGQPGEVAPSQFAAYYELATDAKQCTPITSSAIGTASPTNQMTVCCQ